MGRMLETLKLGEGRRAPLAISKPVDTTPVQDCVVDWEIGGEVPYIEVGGPNKKVELSPCLLKHPAQNVPQPPHLPTEKVPPVAAKAGTVYLTEAKPMTAAFEPWPAPMPTPFNLSADIVAFHQPEHPASKEYAVLLNSLCASLKADAPNVLLFVGMKPHVGASTVLLNLAATAAMQKKSRVIVVDARAGLAERLGHTACVGLAEVLGGTLALEQAIVKTGIASLHLLPAGAKQGPHASGAMAWLLAWLRERYDLVLVHGPTMDDPQAGCVHVPHASGVYLVLPQGEASAASKGIAQSISGMGGRLSGLIHTHFEM
ncbi:MAG: hypothetical protein EXR98_08745 [Gemmataceae bacterium]|nr:hypothetical protein [Gemmataceae bacterium]